MSLIEISQLLGNLGEFIGAIVIVATLIYLAKQIRQNSEQAAAQSGYNNTKGRSVFTFWEYEFHEYEAGRLAEEEFNPAGKRVVFEKNSAA